MAIKLLALLHLCCLLCCILCCCCIAYIVFCTHPCSLSYQNVTIYKMIFWIIMSPDPEDTCCTNCFTLVLNSNHDIVHAVCGAFIYLKVMPSIQKTHTPEAMELLLLTRGDTYPTPLHITSIQHLTRPN